MCGEIRPRNIGHLDFKVSPVSIKTRRKEGNLSTDKFFGEQAGDFIFSVSVCVFAAILELIRNKTIQH